MRQIVGASYPVIPVHIHATAPEETFIRTYDVETPPVCLFKAGGELCIPLLAPLEVSTAY